MDITVAAEEAGTVVEIVGSLDTVTAPDTQTVLDQAIADGATTLVGGLPGAGVYQQCGIADFIGRGEEGAAAGWAGADV